jgi:7,8-dihydroneopterin aldolase/epimerase/oxygenase
MASDPVRIELQGISVYTQHGVTDAEQEVGQRLVIDVALEPEACDAVHTDELADTIDYSAVADLVVAAATETSYRTLERLATVIGERLTERFDVVAARVRAAKPEPPMPYTVGAAAVEVTTRRDSQAAE